MSATPIYHGTLDVRPATGRFDRRTGIGSITVKGWTLAPIAGTNGICPGEEPLVVTLGTSQENWRLEPGRLKPLRNGRTWVYRAAGRLPIRALKKLRLSVRSDGTYTIDFTLLGVDLSRLNTEDPVCQPFAVIVGDDDGFGGISFASPSFTSPRVRIPQTCVASAWPWA